MSQDEKPPKPIYVYVLTDPRYPDDVRYVGVTNNPSRRLRKHINDCQYQTNHRANWIKFLSRNGVAPVMTIIDETDNENWQQCEMRWIAYYRAMGCDLVNSTDGGDGMRNPSEETRKKISQNARNRTFSTETRAKLSNAGKGKRHTEESRRKISESQRGKVISLEQRNFLSLYRTGKRHTEESRRKISESRMGRKHTEESKLKMSNAQKGKPKSAHHRLKMSEIGKSQPLHRISQLIECGKNASIENKKPILQYDKFGNFIRLWDSATDAGKSLGICPSCISKCCLKRKGYQSTGGYVWRYANDPLLGEIPTQLKLDLE